MSLRIQRVEEVTCVLLLIVKRKRKNAGSQKNQRMGGQSAIDDLGLQPILNIQGDTT